jgi:hypothetical protein
LAGVEIALPLSEISDTVIDIAMATGFLTIRRQNRDYGPGGIGANARKTAILSSKFARQIILLY